MLCIQVREGVWEGVDSMVLVPKYGKNIYGSQNFKISSFTFRMFECIYVQLRVCCLISTPTMI